MKRNCCSTCHREIDSRDFYVETKKGKTCSDCLAWGGPLKAESTHLFKPRGPKEHKVQPKKQGANVIPIPLKKAL